MRILWGLMLMCCLGAAPVWAALGEPESSVVVDQQSLHGRIQDQVHSNYRLHVISDPHGAVLREYVSPAGKVFGISWEGPYAPNMPQVLGTYFTYLQQYARTQTGRHGGPLVIQKDDFVFSNAGHMRYARGRAYVPSLVPAGISPEVVQ